MLTMLSQNAISDFKKCWKTEFNKELSDAEAQQQGERFLRLFSMIYRPIPRAWVEKQKKDEIRVKDV